MSTNKVRKIIAVTGARSEYDLLFPVFKGLDQDKRFDLELIVTGSHLSENFGKTLVHIEEDGFVIADKIYNLINTNEKIGRILSLNNQISGLAQTFLRLQPDIILVAGDREEAIAVAMTGAFMDIPVAHFFGGDVAKDGNIDNSVRYATSKFAHIHFPTIAEHKETLLRLGEESENIYIVGNPAIDRFLSTPYLSLTKLFERLNVQMTPEDQYLVLIQHPIITEIPLQEEHIRITLDAIIHTGVHCFINYPNSDAGHKPIIDAYLEYSEKYERLHLFQNLDREVYVNLLRNAECLIGNSSSGLLEAPSLGLPAINIGKRQRGRKHGGNMIFVDNDSSEISRALEKALFDKEFKREVKTQTNPYGDGKTAPRVIKILAEIDLDNDLVHKNITY